MLSNGHGEDTIGAGIARALLARRPHACRIDAWPMVGRGTPYLSAGVALIGARNELPSEGFGTLGLGAFLRDVGAGWVQVHLRQLQSARGMRGAYGFAVAIGDVVPTAAATLARIPFALVGCAKSEYYGPAGRYTWLERWLLRRPGAFTFPRDQRTADALARAGVRCRYVGNPMMDGVETVVGRAPRVPGETVVACLPGSRTDQEANAWTILQHVAYERARYETGDVLHFAFALAPGFDLRRLHEMLAPSSGTSVAWNVDPDDASVARCGRLRATFTIGAIGDVLGRARVAIGLAGTANEQAVGLGVPVVTFATSGAQGDSYLRMKMPFFGASAVRVDAASGPIADAVLAILTEEALHARMAAAGRERMGLPGATDAIVEYVLAQIGDGAERGRGAE